MNTVISTLILFLAFSLPGIGILLTLRAKLHNLEQLLFYSFGISAAYLVFMNLILLRFGLFNPYTESILVLLPVCTALLVKLKSKESITNILPIRTDNAIFLLIIFFLFGSIIVFTSKWNFLISPNMDAGNYEVYSNHFWITGDLYFQLAPYLEKNIPIEYLTSKNTWAFAKNSSFGRPNYMYGFPVLLGLAKLIFNSPYVSWVINCVFSLFSAAIIGTLLLRITKNKWVSLMVLLALCVTPLFYYYSKQIMSEQVALFGFLLFSYSLVEHAKEREIKSVLGIVAGIVLFLLMKLDSFIVPMFFLLAYFIVWIDKTQYNKSIQINPRVMILIGVSILVCALITIWLCNPRYVRHFSTPSIKSYGDTVFIFIYSIAIFIGFWLLAILYSRQFNVLRELFSRINLSQIVHYFIIVIWILFISWNFTVRPVGAPLTEDHNAYNIHRLLTIFSPLFLLITLLALPLVIKQASSSVKVLLLVGLFGLSYLIFNSNHSPPDIWWMRRYLVLLLPTTAILIGTLYRLAVVNRWIAAKSVITYTIGAAILSIIVQAPHMRVLLDYKVNESIPEHIAMLDSQISPDSLVIATISDSLVRGTVNTFRSIHAGPSVLNVPHEQVGHIMSLFPERKNIALITQQELETTEIMGRNFELKSKGQIKRQWINDFGLLLKKHKYSKSSQYYLYITSRG